MDNDPIIQEVRKYRYEYAKQFNFDIREIAADLKKKEQKHKSQLVSFSPKPPRHRKTA